MGLSDIDEIVKFEEMYFGQTLGLNHFKIELNNPYAYFIVCKENDKTLGYISSTLEEMGEILNFFVVEEYRKKGIGKFILDNVILEAKKRNVKSLYLEVSEKNIGAISLYKKCGFNIVRIRKNYYKDSNAYVMIKEFN